MSWSSKPSDDVMACKHRGGVKVQLYSFLTSRQKGTRDCEAPVV